MKTIETLVDDIYGLFGSGAEPAPEMVDDLGKSIALHVTEALKKREPKGFLRASLIGTKCSRRLWYGINRPEVAEAPEPWARLKFLYGHIIEDLTLFLAEVAGHKVERQQATVTLEGIEGHIDALIDGELVDVKSANSRGMDKFKKHKLEDDDPFGYLDQLAFYKEALKQDGTLKDDATVTFIAVDKELGHIVNDTYEGHTGRIRTKVLEAISTVSNPAVPNRGYFPEPDGAAGNQQLCMECRYCEYKKECWPGLRKFIYSSGPRWLTKVVRVPDVPEVKV